MPENTPPADEGGESLKEMEDLIYQQVKDYYQNRLSEEARESFEQRLASDEGFAAEVAECALAYEAVQAEGDRELQRRIEEWKNADNMNTVVSIYPKNEEKVSVRMRKFSRIVYLAAAVVALLVIALPLLLLNRPGVPAPASAGDLYAVNFVLPPAPEARDEAIEPWREAYMAGQYKDAVAALQTLLQNNQYKFRSQAYLYLGLSYLALDEPALAAEAFEMVSSDSFDWMEANWFGALAYLKMNEPTKAAPLLQIVAREGTPNRKAGASEMLKSLDL